MQTKQPNLIIQVIHLIIDSLEYLAQSIWIKGLNLLQMDSIITFILNKENPFLILKKILACLIILTILRMEVFN